MCLFFCLTKRRGVLYNEDVMGNAVLLFGERVLKKRVRRPASGLFVASRLFAFAGYAGRAAAEVCQIYEVPA